MCIRACTQVPWFVLEYLIPVAYPKQLRRWLSRGGNDEGAKPDAAGFYKDEIIAAVKTRHGYTDKPEIYQIVLGDNKVFSREVGTRKQGVKQGR